MWSKLTGSPALRKTKEAKGKGVAVDDPLTSFTSHWASLEAALSSDSRIPAATPISTSRHLSQLFTLLSNELVASGEGGSASLGPCLEYLLKSSMLSTLVRLCVNDNPTGVRLEVLRWYRRAVAELSESFLTQSAVHKPLVRLLRSTLDGDYRLTSAEEEAAVDLMRAVCERISSSVQLLAVFFRAQPTSATGERSSDSYSDVSETRNWGASPLPSFHFDDSPLRSSSPTPSSSSFSSASHSSDHPGFSIGRRKKSEHDFLLFAYLLRFVHRESRTGDFARAGLLYLIEVAMHSSIFPDLREPLVSHELHRSETSATVTLASLANAQLPSVGAREARLALAEYLLDSDFAEVLGAGLGALYGLLPGKLLVRGTGASTTVVKEGASWDDASVEPATSGMVLGGMGPLGDDVDAEEAERQREDEDDRLRALGVGVSDNTEFRESLNVWLKLVKFVQEVVRISSSAGEATVDGEGLESDEVRQQRLIASALASSISASFKSHFLSNVLYPSILECSEADGSAVAVLSYLDALLGVLEEGTAFEAMVIGFLVADEEDARDRGKVASTGNFLSPTPTTSRRLRRRKSSALVLLESASPRPTSNRADSYFTSIGRFSLKDLLVANVHSRSAGTATAALRLLQTILTRHDRWSLGLLDVVLDEAATSFPVVLREEDDQPAVQYLHSPASDPESDDEDVFVYPSLKSPSTPKRRQGGISATPSTVPPLVMGSPLPRTPSVASHFDSFQALITLVGKIDPSYRTARAAGGGSEIVSTGFDNYLRDAEDALASDLGFQRGLAAPPEAAREALPTTPHARRRSLMFGAFPALSTKELAQAKAGYRHRISSTSSVANLLLQSLAHFFSHPPDLNLALTAVLSSLALYPYRSLDGWLLPPPEGAEYPTELDKLVMRSRGPASDDGDDRSIDCGVDEVSRQTLYLSPSKPCSSSPRSSSRSSKGTPTVLSTLAALTDSVAQYRRIIPNFDRFLTERREGLMFVDNLADALDLDDEGGNAFREAVRSLEQQRPEPVQVQVVGTPKSNKRQSGFGAFLSPRSAAPTNNAFATPPRSVRKEPSTSSLGGGDSSTAVGTSPFAAHYKQTGAINVTPVVVTTQSSEDDDEDEILEDGPPDSPSRRLSPAVTSPSSATSDVASETVPVPKREPVEVTLSTILDNVILLEEFIKELSGIISVRRSVGIDALRFIETEQL